jgi:hypothetical protein
METERPASDVSRKQAQCDLEAGHAKQSQTPSRQKVRTAVMKRLNSNKIKRLQAEQRSATRDGGSLNWTIELSDGLISRRFFLYFRDFNGL